MEYIFASNLFSPGALMKINMLEIKIKIFISKQQCPFFCNDESDDVDIAVFILVIGPH